MGKAETEVEKLLTSEVKKLGGTAFKFVSPGCTGVPDRLICLPNGSTWFAEVKTATGKLSARQRVVVDRLARLKQKVIVLYGKEDVQQFIRQLSEDLQR